VANRFQDEITRFLHANQYGFIKSRTIQDCLAWTFEYLHQFQKSKRKCVIIKIYFEKAFDTIEHHILEICLKCKGFPRTIIRMVQEVLSSGFYSVLVNGVLGNIFSCKRGVRQGDPLSPLLLCLGGSLDEYCQFGPKGGSGVIGSSN
jgi:hypothetical protein